MFRYLIKIIIIIIILQKQIFKKKKINTLSAYIMFFMSITYYVVKCVINNMYFSIFSTQRTNDYFTS